jgi:hypothetical protein
MGLKLTAAILLAIATGASCYAPAVRPPSALRTRRQASLMKEPEADQASPEEVTKKWGLEAGLFKALTDKDGQAVEGKSSMTTAKDLLTQYGAAYLLTSIPLAIVSFALCYVLVDNGVDVGALLAKVGIQTSGGAEKAGTVAIAYAAHKAASPIRFPPTVALTPVVARLIGKKREQAK